MAISFVGSHVGSHASTSAQSIALSNLRNESNAQPTLLQGDLIVVAVNVAGTTDVTQANLTPSGYTAAHTDQYGNDSNDTNLQASYKVMGASPDTTVSIPAATSTANGVAYAIYAFRGVDMSSPMDVSATATSGINTGVANAPSITPVSDGAWIMAVGAAGVAAGAVFTNPSGMSATTNHFRSATITTTTVDANVGVALKTDWASGAFDPAAFGGSTSTNTGSWAAATLALRPIQQPISGSLTKTLDSLTSVGSAAVAIAGTVSRTLGAASVSATGGQSSPQPISGSTSATLGGMTSSGTGKLSLLAQAAKALGGMVAGAASALRIAGSSARTMGGVTALSSAQQGGQPPGLARKGPMSVSFTRKHIGF